VAKARRGKLALRAGHRLAPDTVFVASTQYLPVYDIAPWSVADGTLLWTTRYTGAITWDPVAIALSGDGTRLFETGSGRNGGMITVAYQD
jgi:hypothetical protein